MSLLTHGRVAAGITRFLSVGGAPQGGLALAPKPILAPTNSLLTLPTMRSDALAALAAAQAADAAAGQRESRQLISCPALRLEAWAASCTGREHARMGQARPAPSNHQCAVALVLGVLMMHGSLWQSCSAYSFERAEGFRLHAAGTRLWAITGCLMHTAAVGYVACSTNVLYLATARCWCVVYHIARRES